MSEPLRRPESVLVVVTADEQVLLLQRRDWCGFWQSVTGSLLADEAPREAARRELAEETGLTGEPRDLNLRQRFAIAPARRGQWLPGTTHNTEHAFHLALNEPEEIRLEPEEHCAWGWFAADQARWLLSSATNRRALEQIEAQAGWGST